MVSALVVPHRAQIAHLQGLDVVSVLEFAAIDCGVIGQRTALVYEAGLVLRLILLCVLVALQQIGQMSQHAARCSCLFKCFISTRHGPSNKAGLLVCSALPATAQQCRASGA